MELLISFFLSVGANVLPTTFASGWTGKSVNSTTYEERPEGTIFGALILLSWKANILLPTIIVAHISVHFKYMYMPKNYYYS